MFNSSTYDIIIIGARVAGSILATLLGEMGYRVLILDRATFPSGTLSTHFFRAPALRAFKQASIYDQVVTSAPHLTVNYNVIDGIVFPEPVDRPEDYPFYMCVRRIILDDILTRRVKEFPNIELREGTKVIGLLTKNGNIDGIRWRDSNLEGEAKARVIVGADGVRSFLARQVDVRVEHKEPINRAMYFAYFRGISPKEGPAAEFHYNGNTLAYCFPCDSDLTLVAVTVPISQFDEFKSDPQANFMLQLQAMTDLAPRIIKAERQGEINGSGSIPGYLRVPYGKGWALVGDAGMVMDPWSGQGIDQASTHAVILAQYLGDYLSGKRDWQTAMQGYQRDRNEFSLKTYQRTCKLGVDLRPMTQAALQKRGLA